MRYNKVNMKIKSEKTRERENGKAVSYACGWYDICMYVLCSQCTLCHTAHSQTRRVNKQISINKMCQAASLYYTKQFAAAKQIAKSRAEKKPQALHLTACPLAPARSLHSPSDCRTHVAKRDGKGRRLSRWASLRLLGLLGLILAKTNVSPRLYPLLDTPSPLSPRCKCVSSLFVILLPLRGKCPSKVFL